MWSVRWWWLEEESVGNGLALYPNGGSQSRHCTSSKCSRAGSFWTRAVHNEFSSARRAVVLIDPQLSSIFRTKISILSAMYSFFLHFSCMIYGRLSALEEVDVRITKIGFYRFRPNSEPFPGCSRPSITLTSTTSTTVASTSHPNNERDYSN